MHQNTRLTYLGFGSLVLAFLASTMAYNPTVSSELNMILSGIVMVGVGTFLGVTIILLRDNPTSVPIRLMR